MATGWPWLVVAGLGAFHGLNPAMGWLFAVALGLHRRSRRAVGVSLVPITLGHALSIAMVAVLFVAAGASLDATAIRWGAAALLLGWAVWHTAFGHRGRARVGMQVGLGGLFAWSFVMATAHGAGLMLVPALIPLCFGDMPTSDGAVGSAFAAVGLHTAAMLAVTAAIAFAVYEWVGVAFLRRGWINLDYLWTAALVLAAAALLFW